MSVLRSNKGFMEKSKHGQGNNGKRKHRYGENSWRHAIDPPINRTLCGEVGSQSTLARTSFGLHGGKTEEEE